MSVFIFSAANYNQRILFYSPYPQDKSSSHDKEVVEPEAGVRVCNYMSTGAILLADILPALFVKFIGPFLPFYVK